MRRAAGGTSLLLLTGCSGAQSALDTHGPAARQIADIWWPMLVAGTVVYLVVAALVAYLLIRRRPNVEPRPDPGSSRSARSARRWIVVGGVALPAVVLVPLFIASMSTTRELMHAAHADITVQVTGRLWWWQIRYKGAEAADDVIAANELHVPVGRRVRIELTTADVIHSLWIPSLQGKTDLVPGRVNVMWVEADRAGVLRAQCAEYCGLQHTRMAMPVIAQPQREFEKWLSNERSRASVPTDSTALVGSTVFLSAGCGTCHTIRGTSAGGIRGPDLTHFASRRTIAAGTLTNVRGNIAGWIADPQHIKPGSKMPRVPLDPAQLIAVVKYLETLR
jgi:cytochrome c oxidase subunit II